MLLKNEAREENIKRVSKIAGKMLISDDPNIFVNYMAKHDLV